MIRTVFLLFFTHISFSQPLTYYDIPIKVEITKKPTFFKTNDGLFSAIFSIIISNFSHLNFEINDIQILNKDESLITYSASDFKDNSKVSILYSSNEYFSDFKSGEHRLLKFLVKSSHSEINKLVLKINLTSNQIFNIWNKTQLKNIEFKHNIDVDTDGPLEISLPVRGKNWRMSNSIGLNTSHQFYLMYNGDLRCPQRFAIDFQVVDEKNNPLPTPLPDKLKNQMFYSFNKKVYSVSNGIVVDVIDSLENLIPDKLGNIQAPYHINNQTVGGNSITIRYNEKYYIYYAHLQRGSIHVNIGDSVFNGQYIGNIGNSGNSVGPHLHFQITDSKDHLSGNSIEFVFDNFFDKMKSTQYKNTMPLNNSIIDVFK